MEQFLVPAGEGASEYMEKKSRFLGLIVPVTTEAEARARLEAVKKQEYDARHNCWAYIHATRHDLLVLDRRPRAGSQ